MYREYGMSRFTIIALVALIASAAYAYNPLQSPRFNCAIQDELVKAAFKDGLGWLSTAVVNKGYVIQVFTNDQDGRFRVIGIDNTFHACVVMEGIDWQYVIPNAFQPY